MEVEPQVSGSVTNITQMAEESERMYKELERDFAHDAVSLKEAKTLFEKIATEKFWDFFFKGEPIDGVHEEIRKQISGTYGGIYTEDSSGRNYQQFMKWVDQYLDPDAIGGGNLRRLKVMYFARFHHSSLPHAEKLHILLQIRPSGISKHLSIIQAVCPDGTTHWVTHEFSQAYSPDYLKALQGKIFFSEKKASNSMYSDDDKRNDFKEMVTRTTGFASFYFDEETQERKVSVEKVRMNQLHMTVTTDSLEKFDQNVLSRYKTLPLPATASIMSKGMRPPLKHLADEQKEELIIKDHIKVYRIYYLVYMALQAGVTGEATYGMDMNPVKRAASELGISDVKKIERLCEMTRCITISSVVWAMLCSSNGQEIDPYFLRVLLTHLTITEEMIVDALGLLAF